MIEEKKIQSLLKKLPEKSGVYKMKDKESEIIYIGKAKNLKNRVKSYFQQIEKQSIKTQKLIEKTEDIEWVETNSEEEALILETNYIKELLPKFNVLMKDDKNYVYARISVQDDFPKIEVVREIKKDGAMYFGPKSSAGQLHSTLEFINKLYPLRTCKLEITEIQNGVECKGHEKYPCLEYQLKRCSGPCINEISKQEYGEFIKKIIAFFKGRYKEVLDDIQKRMMEVAMKKDFEKAAKYRDLMKIIQGMSEKQIVSDVSMESRDIVGIFHDLGKTFVALFQVRIGKVISNENFVLENEGEYDEMIQAFLTGYYEKAGDMPKEILLPKDLEYNNSLEFWFKEKLNTSVKILTPQKGKKSDLVDLAMNNAKSYAESHRARWMNDKRKKEQAEKDIIELINFNSAGSKNPQGFPKRMECFDISHYGGESTVASMAVFLNGEESKAEYRRYKLKTTKEGEIDDFKSIKEVLERRILEIENIISLEKNGEDNEGFEIKKLDKKEVDEKILEPKIIFISGTCNSGKTSLSKTISKKLKYKHIEGDKIADYLYPEKPAIWLPEHSKKLEKIHDEIIKKAKEFLDDKKSIVIDYVLDKKEEVEKYKKEFPNIEFTILTASKDVLLKRENERKEKDQSGEERVLELDKIQKDLVECFFNPAGSKNPLGLWLLDNSKESPEEIFEKYFKEDLNDFYALYDNREKLVYWAEVKKYGTGLRRIMKESFVGDITSCRLHGVQKTFLKKLFKELKGKDIWIFVEEIKIYEEVGFKKLKTLEKNWQKDFGLVPEEIAKNTEIDSGYALKIKIPKNESSKISIPDFILIDGGKGQLSSVVDIFEKYDWEYKDNAFYKDDKYIIVCSIAKKNEEIFFPNESNSRNLPSTSEGSYLLQRLRDESHRFAVEYNRQTRTKKTFTSVLDKIPGLGQATKKKLLKSFGSVDGVKSASEENLRLCVGEKLMEEIKRFFE